MHITNYYNDCFCFISCIISNPRIQVAKLNLSGKFVTLWCCRTLTYAGGTNCNKCEIPAVSAKLTQFTLQKLWNPTSMNFQYM